MASRVGLPGLSLRCVCTGRGTHPPRELAYLSGRYDDDGHLWILDAEVSTGGEGRTEKFDLTEEGRRRAAAYTASWEQNPSRLIDQARPARSSPHREIRSDEKQPWIFKCPTCTLDMRLPTPVVAAMWIKADTDKTYWRDLNPAYDTPTG